MKYRGLVASSRARARPTPRRGARWSAPATAAISIALALASSAGCAGKTLSTGAPELDTGLRDAGAAVAERVAADVTERARRRSGRASSRASKRYVRSAVVELRSLASPLPTHETLGVPGLASPASAGGLTTLGSGLILTPDGLVAANARVVETAGPLVAALADGRSFAARTVHVDGEVAVLQLVGAEKLPTVGDTTPPELAALEPVEPGWLGLLLGDSEAGAVIERVPSGTPAASARLQVGDVVTAVGRDRLRTASELREQIAARRPGERIRLKLLRNGKPKSVRVTVGAEYRPTPRRGELMGERGAARQGERAATRGARARPRDDARAAGRDHEDRRARARADRGAPLFADDSPKLGVSALATEDGLLVEQVTRGGFADQLGIREGATILAINGVRLYEPGDIADALRKRPDALEVTVRRDGAVRVVTLERRDDPPPEG